MIKVSVIIPVYNSEKYLDECIDSVINQTYKNLEIIVIDDNSQDNSLTIINKKKDKRIKIISLNHTHGASYARNKGINSATGEYICFLDSDDCWKLDKIEKQVKFMSEHKYTFIYSGYAYYKKNKIKEAKVPKKMKYKDLLKNHAIFTSTVMLNMNYLKKEDILMPNLVRGQDMATWWKILRSGITAYGITEVLALYRVGNKSLSSNKLVAVCRTWKLFKRERLPFIKKVYYYCCYIFNAIKRRL